MFQWLRNAVGSGPRATPAEQPSRAATAAANSLIRARYDNAQTTDESKRSWWAADYLSAKSANSYQVRRQLRIRSRYEVSNNPYLYGVTNGNADDLVGTGPTLQVRTGNATFDRAVEKAWAEWCAEVDLAEKVRTLKLARTVDGEGFLVLRTVREMDSPVKLYPVDLEADQVTTPAPANVVEQWVDGLDLHPVTGRPVAYHVLRYHPGDWWFPGMNPLVTDRIPARHVIHWFPKFRPSQVRGVPVFTSALDLFAQLRAFRGATLGAAQIAARYAAVLEQSTDVGVGGQDEGDGEFEPFEAVPIDVGMQVVLPAGFKMNQFKPEHPATTYEMFQTVCLGEACRPLNYPLVLALGTAQKFNFSSAKLDFTGYRNGLSIERADCGKTALAPLFREFYAEGSNPAVGWFPMWDGYKTPPHEWHWPGFEPLDPVADAAADHDRRAHGTLTDREFWARRGYDWLDVYEQLETERKERENRGLSFGDPVKTTVSVNDPAAAETEAANAG